MNIAKKTLEEVIDTEIARLRKEVEEQQAQANVFTVQRIEERLAGLKTAVAAAPKLDALIADAAFLAVMDKEVWSDFEGGVVLELQDRHDVIQMMGRTNSFRGSYERDKKRRYRFVVAAIPLDDE